MFHMTDGAAAELLAELRAEMGRQQRRSSELGAVIGRSRVAAWARLTGRRKFSAAELVKTAEWLGVSLDELAARAKRQAA